MWGGVGETSGVICGVVRACEVNIRHMFAGRGSVHNEKERIVQPQGGSDVSWWARLAHTTCLCVLLVQSWCVEVVFSLHFRNSPASRHRPLIQSSFATADDGPRLESRHVRHQCDVIYAAWESYYKDEATLERHTHTHNTRIMNMDGSIGGTGGGGGRRRMDIGAQPTDARRCTR